MPVQSEVFRTAPRSIAEGESNLSVFLASDSISSLDLFKFNNTVFFLALNLTPSLVGFLHTLLHQIMKLPKPPELSLVEDVLHSHSLRIGRNIDFPVASLSSGRSSTWLVVCYLHSLCLNAWNFPDTISWS